MLSLSRLIPTRLLVFYDLSWITDTLVRCRVFVLPSLQELEELLRASLLKETHQGALHSLHFCAGDFGNPAISINETPSDLLKFKITGDVGVHKDFSEFPRRNNELGNKIDGVITITA
jgi:hypothetical protein